MQVVKRNGTKEDVSFDEITKRLKSLCYGLSDLVDPIKVGIKVVDGLYDGVTTKELDILSAEISASMAVIHSDYSLLASRISIANLHSNTRKSFSEKIKMMYKYVNPKNGMNSPIVSKETYDVVMSNAYFLDAKIDYTRDFNYDYFGFKTLERSYLLKIDGEIIECPQDMIMRVSVGIHGEDLDSVIETYDLMSQKFFTHATPTLFNSGTPKPQLSSCFLLQMQDDSIDGIYNTLKQTAKISQSAGGVGLSIHNIRANGSYIRGTNGNSNGIVTMLRVFDMTARYVDQGGGKRKGSFAMYIEPWHADIFDFLELRKNHGKEEMRARDLFLAMWMNDLFMERVEADSTWTLMCPNECPNLYNVHGEEFRKLYISYEEAGKGKKTIKARELWEKILDSQIETGLPYMLYKDSANEKSNQKNLGTIRSSNLCCEIMEYTAQDEIAVCNLASLSLPMFVQNGFFNHKLFYSVVRKVTKNLNKIIDINYYPIEEAKNSNLRHRPIGLGVQGLADLFMMLRLPFTSKEAKLLNKEIFETLYFASMSESMELAKKDGAYSSFKGSPLSEGKFQFDLWKIDSSELNGRWDWETLRKDVVEHGVRNSLLVAPMPTASTSQILGNNEAFEPYTSNIYVRRTLSGEFIVVNKFLLQDLIELGLWNDDMKQAIMRENGSIQNIPSIPTELKELYKTVWEMSMKDIIDMSKERGYFVDQSQSLNMFMQDANYSKLTSMHFYAWKAGLKTGMYYLRTKPAVDAIKFTLKNDKQKEVAPVEKIEPIAVEDYKAMLLKAQSSEPDYCEMCGS